MKPTIGRIVHFVRAVTPVSTVERPAIIVHVWDEGSGEYGGTVQLQVFNDGDGGPSNDGLPNVTWETSVPFSADKGGFSWHWPERDDG